MAVMIDLIKDIVKVALERAETHKALRILNKQEWSIEFLQAMLLRAADVKGKQLQITITGPGNRSITMTTLEPPMSKQLTQTDSIFDHLDDDAAINRFIKTIGA
jgi:hypothetical protein